MAQKVQVNAVRERQTLAVDDQRLLRSMMPVTLSMKFKDPTIEPLDRMDTWMGDVRYG